ncbi:Putative Lipopolysaccharide export system protein LptC [Cardinium endosymbiont of Oedothorax gibbosus]|nr:Putative Lipopolysaccharide export system protein LptC [Cardinium endosymbiont of Oedothorax gibbosus]
MIRKNCSFKLTYRGNGLVGLLYFFIMGCCTPIYADFQEGVPLLETTRFELLATDGGRLYATIKAGEMCQYENGNVALAGGIEIVLWANTVDQEEGPTHIQADTLSYSKEKDLCMIAGNVLVSKPQQSLSMHTEQLWYDTKQEIIFTEWPIVITDKGHVLRGSGLRATKDLTKYTVTGTSGTVEIKQETVLGANPL